MHFYVQALRRPALRILKALCAIGRTIARWQHDEQYDLSPELRVLLHLQVNALAANLPPVVANDLIMRLRKKRLEHEPGVMLRSIALHAKSVVLKPGPLLLT